jgi:hypothetical protein
VTTADRGGDGPDYIVASREGLYVVNHAHWRRVADGYFFGVTVLGAHVYCFKTVSREAAMSEPRSGQIVRYRCSPAGTFPGPEILARGLDHNCHQVDFFDGSFYVVDTRGQRLIEFDDNWRCAGIHQILPPADEGSAEYAHLNSFLGCDDTIYVMQHNFRRQLPSKIVQFDRCYNVRRTITLSLSACHDIVRLETGRLLFCESHLGRLSSDDGSSYQIDNLLTRGLAVGPDEIAVGSSLYGQRLARDLLPGFVTFLDRSYRRVARLRLPAAPTQIRRLDGLDLSLSQPRQWRQTPQDAAFPTADFAPPKRAMLTSS